MSGKVSYNALRAAIEKSRDMLSLKNDWDDTGAVPISQIAFNDMRSFLEQAWEGAEFLKEDFDLDIPKINPSGDGSIDLHWKNSDRELLVNIPSDGCFASYYGDDYGDIKITGTLKIYESHPSAIFSILHFVLSKDRSGFVNPD